MLDTHKRVEEGDSLIASPAASPQLCDRKTISRDDARPEEQYVKQDDVMVKYEFEQAHETKREGGQEDHQEREASVEPVLLHEDDI